MNRDHTHQVINLLNTNTPIEDNHVASGITEFYDKHPISKMLEKSDYNIPASEEGTTFLRVSDSWRTEWHSQGVQVLLNGFTDLPTITIRPHVRSHLTSNKKRTRPPFKLPTGSYVQSSAPILRRINVTARLKHQISLPVDYGLDRFDFSWLHVENEERRVSGLPCIEGWQMQRIMDLMERISHSQLSCQVASLQGSAVKLNGSSSAVTRKCDICQTTENENDELLTCHRCLVTVHRTCYLIDESTEGNVWLCQRCEMRGRLTATCFLCPNTGGALRISQCGRWCHMSCVLGLPDMATVQHCVSRRAGSWVSVRLHVQSANSTLENSDHMSLTCCECGQQQGYCASCSYDNCHHTFHITCALNRGFQLKLIDRKCGRFLQVFCSVHSKDMASSSESTFPESAENIRCKMIIDLEKRLEQSFPSQCASVAVTLQRLHPAVLIPRPMQDTVTSYWRLKRHTQHHRLTFDIACGREKEDQKVLVLTDSLDTPLYRGLCQGNQLRERLADWHHLMHLIVRRDTMKLTLMRKQYTCTKRQLRKLRRWNPANPVPQILLPSFPSTVFPWKQTAAPPSADKLIETLEFMSQSKPCFEAASSYGSTITPSPMSSIPSASGDDSVVKSSATDSSCFSSALTNPSGKQALSPSDGLKMDLEVPGSSETSNVFEKLQNLLPNNPSK